MKKILFIALLMNFINCKAQSPIIDLETPGFLPKMQNAYYKDIGNYLEQFAGTWVYTDGSTSFKIVIQKKTMVRVTPKHYEDVLIGEYQYIKDGVEKVNTLQNLVYGLPNLLEHSIIGNFMCRSKYGNPLCNDCNHNDKKVANLYFVDPITKLDAELYLRYTGNNQMRIFIRQKMILSTPEHPVTNIIMTVPTGEYIMTRQQ